jgi:hypothetical protein
MAAPGARAAETIWIEAEHLDGVRGYCWPMGRPEMKKTDGHWGLSGPGWAAEWNQGGESGFLSIAAGADDDKAVATAAIEVPADGRYFVWVRYGDWREKTERFQVRLEQGGTPWIGRYGEQAVVDEDNEAKLYWGWAFAWDRREADLKKGPATLRLVTATRESEPRQVDVIVLTTDPAYHPRLKDRPPSPTWDLLETYRHGLPTSLEPLARHKPEPKLPKPWRLRTCRDKGFLYLWNTSAADAEASWLGDKPDRVRVPYHVGDKDVREAFEKMYAGRDDVPIFGDPRIVPTFHAVGAGLFATDAKTGEILGAGRSFARWLDEHPERCWATMMNYHGGTPVGEKGVQAFAKYRDRYVGSIAGESLGYFYPDAKEMKEAAAAATTRRRLVESFTPLALESNAEKYRKVYGKDLDKNPYADVIACLSVGNTAFIPLSLDWGARTVGYESSAMTSSVLAMRWAFLRGGARQHGALTATYRSCNFGDSSTIFSNTGSFHAPQNILDNYYSVYAGAGMTWYKMDIWYQYMAGSAMFYHEQGFDEFWMPGGTSAAGRQGLQLSPKGKLVDRFLRVTARETDRGHPFTPVAFLVDYAHGWEPAPFWPSSFGNFHQSPDRFRYGDHERMLEEYFWTAFFPIGPESQKPMTGTNEVYLPGVFGDIFDVIFAYPDVAKWRTIDTYPVVIVAGEIELTEAEGKRLAEYVDKGGTLLVADDHLTGPGAKALALPETGPQAEADGYKWFQADAQYPSQRFRYRPIRSPTLRRATEWTHKALASAPNGDVFCAAMDRGQGRLVYLSVPRGMGIDRRAVPVLARLFAHLARGLMPVEVEGQVEWLVNRTDAGWIVTLLNPAGQPKPQQGILPTDYRENRTVTIKAHVPVSSARDWLMPDDKLPVKANTVPCEVSAGGVRIIELK